jgi:hypothetical protein
MYSKRLIVLAALLWSGAAFGQAALQQGGPWTPGHVPQYSGTGTRQPIVQDGGGAGGGAIGVNPSELGLTIRSQTNTYPASNIGNGPSSTNFCDYDAPINNSSGYHYFCLSPNAQGGGLIAYGASGTAAQLPLKFIVNGTSYSFPFATGGIVGPNTTVVGDIAIWNNVTGTLLKDVAVLPAANGGAGTVNGALKANGSGLVTQAACADLSNGGSACSTNTGTTGGTIPLNNGGFTQSGTVNFTGPFQINGNVQTFPSSIATLARTDAGQTFTGIQTFTTPIAASSVASMTATVGGGVPTPPNDATQFLDGAGAFATPSLGMPDNLLPNVQWQLFSSLSFITKYNSLATGTETPVNCSAFQTANNQPTFTCSNTGQVKVGDIVVVTIASSGSSNFWVFNTGVITCVQVQCNNNTVTAARVVAVTANTSITLRISFGGITPGSSVATVLTPIAPGDSGVLTRGPDGWTKTASLILTVDDFTTNVYPGAYRPMLLVKGITGSETVCWNAPVGATDTGGGGVLPAFAGRTVTYGAAVYQKIQGGAGTWQLSIADSASTVTSASGTGKSLGGYQYLSVTKTISSTTTSLAICLNTIGNAGDAYYFALPTASFVPTLIQSQLHQNSHEIIRAQAHWNPPLLTGLIITFPTSQLVAGCNCYGWNNIDMEAISLGQVHKSVSAISTKVELTTSAAGTQIFTVNNANVSFTTFGPQVISQVATFTNANGPVPMPLNFDGTFAIYTNISGLAFSGSNNVTFDFTNADASMPTSVN